MYSPDLRDLIKEMVSIDPTSRPSADDILAKPFLREAVDRNKTFSQALEQRFMMSLNIFDETYNEHYDQFEALVKEWGETTDSLEKVHHKYTAGALSGSVIGAAGGITTVVGAILAPFTFGASLTVTGVGVGVGVAGGVTELMNLGLLANVGRIAAQTARVGRAEAAGTAAVTGVLSGILVIVDTIFIVKDSIDIHRMRQGKVDNPKKVKSSLLKSIAEMRKTHKDLCDVLKEIKETREELNDYIEMARERDLNRYWESLNL
ncbi:hypothetical protein M9458_058170 [Cirrhinus mrigala]|uniref:Apolipo L3-like protein n=1 Tax=Cirrhinus mrigala TaxID=683832 RepID=A0ABD0MB34_CIRMR